MKKQTRSVVKANPLPFTVTEGHSPTQVLHTFEDVESTVGVVDVSKEQSAPPQPFSQAQNAEIVKDFTYINNIYLISILIPA